MVTWESVTKRVIQFQGETPNNEYQKRLQEMLDAGTGGDEDVRRRLADMFSGPLRFGTAGLRGEVGPGLARMNRVSVGKACYGLGKVLSSLHPSGARVVIGFDARRMSRRFAEDSLEILSAMGHQIDVFDSIVPTPVLAFAVKKFGCHAGIMVTASHNPPLDNGYKVYWGNGAQIIPPIDGNIAAAIDAAPLYGDIPRRARFEGESEGTIHHVPSSLEDDYFSEIAAQATGNAGHHGALKIVHTAMHGTGHRSVMRALRAGGFRGMHSVCAQTEPDGAFPTVSFPNPEEDGALDLAIAAAQETDADCIFANDPDTDRLAVAVKSRDKMSWVRLSGNQVGGLLGAHLLHSFARRGDKRKALVCTTLVSSSMLSRVASAEGARFEETLTGFKWIANTAVELEQDGTVAFVFGYEEALGYACGPAVWDKDGVSATVRMAELLAELKAAGQTVWDRWDELSLKYGISEDTSWSVKCPGLDGRARLQRIMGHFRDTPPTNLMGEAIVRTRDLERGTDTDADDGKASVAKADVVTFWTASGIRMTVRPSGTEPKVKFYLDVAGKADDAAGLMATRKKLQRTIAQSREEIEAIVSNID